MKKQTKLNYWVVDDNGVHNCNKKLYDDFKADDRPAFKSHTEALEFAIGSLCSRIEDLEKKIKKRR